jgi:hypothetical protein
VSHLLHKLPRLQLLPLLQQAHLHGVLRASHLVDIGDRCALPVLQERAQQHQGGRALAACCPRGINHRVGAMCPERKTLCTHMLMYSEPASRLRRPAATTVQPQATAQLTHVPTDVFRCPAVPGRTSRGAKEVERGGAGRTSCTGPGTPGALACTSQGACTCCCQSRYAPRLHQRNPPAQHCD